MNKTAVVISIVIPNYNGASFLDNCLASVLACDGNFEIIVVDDASQDESLKILSSYENVTTLVNSKNSGFAASVNRGIAAARGEFVLLLNNDVVVEPDFVTKLYERINMDARCFSVSSRMIRYYERDKLDDTGDFLNILGWGYKRGDGKSIDRFKKADKVFSTCAGAGLYRKCVIDEIGGFDEAFFAYLEDIDLSYRAKIYGYYNAYEPAAVCYHIGSATTADGQKYSDFKVKISARNNVYLCYKNLPLLQLLINLPFLIIGFGIKVIRFSLNGFGKAYRSGFAEAFRSLGKLKKTPFRMRHLGHYVRIEGELILNLFRYIGDKIL